MAAFPNGCTRLHEWDSLGAAPILSRFLFPLPSEVKPDHTSECRSSAQCTHKSLEASLAMKLYASKCSKQL
eukprot:2467031-Amphidinium_carterae.1